MDTTQPKQETQTKYTEPEVAAQTSKETSSEQKNSTEFSEETKTAETANNTVPKPNSKGGFPTLTDLLALLGIVLGIQVVVSIGSLLVFSLLPQENVDLTFRIQIIYTVSMLLSIGGVMFYRHRRHATGKWLHLGRGKFSLVSIGWGIVMLFAMGIVIEPLMNLLPEVQQPWTKSIWSFLPIVIFAPLLEEILCRGLILESLRSRYGVVVAWLLSSFFFGILHLQPAQVIYASCAGLVLGYIYLITRTLWASMLLHAINNLLSFTMIAIGMEDFSISELIENPTLYTILYILALILLGASAYKAWQNIQNMDKKTSENTEEKENLAQ